MGYLVVYKDRHDQQHYAEQPEHGDERAAAELPVRSHRPRTPSPPCRDGLGIAIAAKLEIYTMIDRLAANGCGILLISSEIEEAMAMSDRIVVMSRGEIVGAFPLEWFEQEIIMRTVKDVWQRACWRSRLRPAADLARAGARPPAGRETLRQAFEVRHG